MHVLPSRRRLATTGVLALAVPLSVLASAAPARACVPHVEGSGPTVTVSPDYQHPGQSDVGYDSSDFDVAVVTCL